MKEGREEGNEAIVRKVEQLTVLFNNMFSKESLRRNVYIFNALSPQMEIPFKKIMEERRVAAITRHEPTVKQALDQCSFIECSGNRMYRILIPGDSTIIQINFGDTKQNQTNISTKSNKNEGNEVNQKEETSKDQSQVVQSKCVQTQIKFTRVLPQNQKTLLSKLTKQMKCKIQQQSADKWRIQFVSQAAARQFIQRIKSTSTTMSTSINPNPHSNQPKSKCQPEFYILKEEGCQYPVQVKQIERNPYLCLSDAISSVKKEKSARIQPQQFDYASYYSQLAYYYPVFIRRAIDSDEEEGEQPTQTHGKARERLDSNDFPKVQ